MDVTSTYKFARISALKARDLARAIQGLPVSEALDILNFTPKKAAELFAKTMKTALADAENNFELPLDGLVVKEATVGEGPTFKRWKARARGSAAPIRKRTSHIRIVLTDDVAPAAEKPAPAKKTAKKKVAAKAADEPKKEKAPAKKAASESKSDVPKGAKVDERKGLVYDTAPADADDLKEIGGVGPALEEKLNSFGIYKFDQIAKWTKKNVAEFDELLSFKGRIERDEWISKAKDLHKEKHGK